SLSQVEISLKKEGSARLEGDRRLARYYIANGSRHFDENDHWAAALWYSKAWEIDPDASENDLAHRLRLAFVLAKAPRLHQTFFHDGYVYDAAASPTGKRVATIPAGQTVWLWDVESGAAVARLEHRSQVTSATWYPDGSRVITI